MPQEPSLADRTCLVTGGSSGIGYEIAKGLAARGAQVVVACRDRARGESSVARMRRETGSERVELLLADLSAFPSVRRMARDVLRRYPALHLLVNNAGVFRRHCELSEDGFESTFATNHLGPYLLTRLLLERLRASAPARIVNLTSDLHRRASLDLDDPLDDPKGGPRYRSMAAYGRSKLANLLFTRELARRLAGSQVDVNAVHPGGVATRIGQGDGGWVALLFRLGRPFLLRPEQGADTPLWLATSDELAGESGLYFIRRKRVEPSAAARDDRLARELWERSAKWVGLDPDEPSATESQDPRDGAE
ncbi:MAG: SDR family oxidoreductase [Myxococcota bacterium]